MSLNLSALAIVGGGGAGIVNIPPTVANFAALPAAGNFDGAIIETIDNNDIFAWNAGGAIWIKVAGTGVALSAAYSASIGATINASVVSANLFISTTAAPAGTQGISNIINTSGGTGLQSYFPTGALTENTSSVLQFLGAGKMVGNTFGIQVNQSSGSTSGYLSNTDWTTFNNKVSTSRTIGTTFPLLGGGDLSADRVLSMPIANGTTGGYLSSTDWTTFNSKQSAISVGPFSNTSFANGATLFGPTFQIGAADFTNPGGVSVTGQTFAGDKTFVGVLAAPTGSASAVGFHLGSQVGTGFYSSAVNQLGIAAAGSTVGLFGTSGLNLYNLSASQAVVSDANKLLVSLAYGSTNVNSTLMVRDSSGRSQVTDPVMAQDISSKNYVDTVASGLNPLQAVYAASTANIPGSYVNGVGGVGAQFTITATGTFTVDGVTPPVGARFLLKNQTGGNGFQNGIYDVTNAGSVGVSPILTRSLDYNTPATVNAGDLIPVLLGTANTLTSWLQTATITTIGTDALVFTQWTANPSSYLLKASNLSDVSTKATAFDNLSPMSAGGDLIYGGASGTGTRLPNGNAGDVLTSQGTTVAPHWVAPSAGGVYSFIGSAKIAGQGGGNWTRTNTALGAFTAQTAFGGPVVILNPGTGTIQTTDTDLPRFTVNGLATGTYKVTIDFYAFGAGVGQIYSFAINDGSVTGTPRQFTAPAAGRGSFVSLVEFFTESSGNISFEVYGASGSGAVSIEVDGTGNSGGDMFFSIEKVG